MLFCLAISNALKGSRFFYFNFLHQLKWTKSSLNHRGFSWQVNSETHFNHLQMQSRFGKNQGRDKWEKKSPSGSLTTPSCLLSAVIHQRPQRTHPISWTWPRTQPNEVLWVDIPLLCTEICIRCLIWTENLEIRIDSCKQNSQDFINPAYKSQPNMLVTQHVSDLVNILVALLLELTDFFAFV